MPKEIVTMESADEAADHIDYRLNILGIRVRESYCQLIARSGTSWAPLGRQWPLPLQVPRTSEQLEAAAGDTLLVTAYQYDVEQPGSDLVDVLSGAKAFSAALK